MKKDDGVVVIPDQEQHLFMRAILDKIELTARKGVSTHTPFLNPSHLKWLMGKWSIYEKTVSFKLFQLFEDSEYVMLCFCEKGEESTLHCPFHVIRLIYTSKFGSVAHRDVLGTLMSLGLKRELVGDIRMEAGTCYVAIAKELSAYVIEHMTTVKKLGIKASEIAIEDVPPIPQSFQLIQFTIASLRLDAIIAAITKGSRDKAQNLVAGQKVKLNYMICEDQSKNLSEGDLISIRGFGRYYLEKLQGETKKNKIRVQIKHIQS